MHVVRAPPKRLLMFGQRYQVPSRVLFALEQTFEASVRDVKVVEYSLYAQAHFGMTATTRPNLVLLAIGGDEFASNPELLLHEYFHVIRQWNSGSLTSWRYLIESARFGYRDNRFEQEARDFAAAAVEQYRASLADACGHDDLPLAWRR